MNGDAQRWQQLLAAHASGRLAHALLLAGPRGTGKAGFAARLAAFLLCEHAEPARWPCGACRGCALIAAGSHPNLMRLGPAEDKRDIAIDDVRDLIDRLHLSSHYGGAKVAIIEPADALNASGVNALLKTIEEPPPATYVLLVSERWRALPATLRSRCQILRFARSGRQAVAEDANGWGKALADACEGRMHALRVAQGGLKRDEAQKGLEIWLHTAAGWLGALAAPGHGRGIAPPKGISAAAVGRLVDDTLAALRALERNGNPSLLVESIIIKASQRG